MLKKISVTRIVSPSRPELVYTRPTPSRQDGVSTRGTSSLPMTDGLLFPTQNRPATPARDPRHPADRVDDSRMSDRFEHRQVAGAVPVHVAGGEIESAFRGKAFRHD